MTLKQEAQYDRLVKEFEDSRDPDYKLSILALINQLVVSTSSKL